MVCLLLEKKIKGTVLLRFSEVSWVQKDQIPNLDLAYDMLPLMEMMEAPDKSEFFYRHRTDDGWEKEIF